MVVFKIVAVLYCLGFGTFVAQCPPRKHNLPKLMTSEELRFSITDFANSGVRVACKDANLAYTFESEQRMAAYCQRWGYPLSVDDKAWDIVPKVYFSKAAEANEALLAANMKCYRLGPRTLSSIKDVLDDAESVKKSREQFLEFLQNYLSQNGQQ